jgi:hypothetical protein
MTDLTPMIRDAYQDDSLPAVDRDRLWSTMQHAQARQARTKLLVRLGLFILAAITIAAVYAAMRSSSNPVALVPVAADSISNNSPVERSMTQDKEAASNLMPLLDHRNGLMSDIRRLEDRQIELAQVLNGTPSGTPSHNVLVGQLKSVEQQIEATKIAISVIDAQLAGHPVPVPAVPPVPPVNFSEWTSPQVIVNPGLSDELIWTSGVPVVLLALAVVAMLGYMRRIARTTREALAAIERQVSSQHTTLASGIDAIAVEVERLGEGQRFMSKVLAGSEAKPAPIART